MNSILKETSNAVELRAAAVVVISFMKRREKTLPYN